MQTIARTLDLGGVVLGGLLDAHAPFIRFREAFSVNDELERIARERWGELVEGPDWMPTCHVFTIASDETTVLVDAGVGPAGGGSFIPGRQGWLPSALAEVGFDPEDIDTVVLTHL